jgi:hypothetical protein
MNLDLSFESLVFYDPGKPGVSIDIELSLKELMVSIPAKVDTGASHCVFARVHGERLGLDIESGEPLLMSTPNGSFRTSGHWVTLSAGEFSFDSMVFFAYDENFTRNVLGRHGWLDRMIIGINDYDGKLYLSRYK